MRPGLVGSGARAGRASVAPGALAVLAALALVACAGDPPPWDVRPDQRPRFDETRRICRALTDGEGGAPRPAAFDRCMERRGFHRKPWWRLWN